MRRVCVVAALCLSTCTASCVTFFGSALAKGGRRPTAAFSFSPTNPVTGQSVYFDGSGSSCDVGPCTYYYHDITATGTGDFPLIGPGSSNSGSYTFNSAGTKYVQLVVTDAKGRVARVEHDVVVSASSSGGGSG